LTPLPDQFLHELTSDPRELSRARDIVRLWTRQHGWNEHQVADVVLAADEALTNVIRHGYQCEPGQRIFVHFERIDDPARGEGLELRVRDFARQVPLDQIRGRDLDQPRPGGLGVHLIKSLMDEAVYSHADGGGMLLVMRKYKSTPPRDCGCDQASRT